MLKKKKKLENFKNVTNFASDEFKVQKNRNWKNFASFKNKIFSPGELKIEKNEQILYGELVFLK